MLERLDGIHFDWLSWRNGTILDVLGIKSRYNDLVRNRELIRKHAIGWCKGENLYCRPKSKHIGIMFSVNDNRFWTHFTEKEFEEIFEV